ncbi:MAG: site-specific integrase [Planctomycetota bacterium]
MTVSEIVHRFLAHKAATVTPGTLTGYRRGLFWLLASFEDVAWEDLVRADVKDALQESFLGHHGQELKAATKNRNRGAFKMLQNYVVDELEAGEEVLKKHDLKNQKTDRREVFVDWDDFRTLAKHLRRDALPICEFLMLTAARPGEACNARIEDIEERVGLRVVVLEEHKTAKKTGKPRRITLNGEASEVVERAIGGRREGPIFRTKRCEPWTPSNLSSVWRAARSQAGLDPRLVLYTTRHGAVTRALKAGVPIAFVAQMAGHEDMKTTQGYAHLGDEEAAKAAAMAAVGFKAA